MFMDLTHDGKGCLLRCAGHTRDCLHSKVFHCAGVMGCLQEYFHFCKLHIENMRETTTSNESRELDN